jgi:PHD/YefM family antitoxin component YafN of YafNO toxin-antitoxin module
VPILLERNGEPVAVILDVDEYEDRLNFHRPYRRSSRAAAESSCSKADAMRSISAAVRP